MYKSLNNINNLIKNAKKVARKSFKGKYLTIIKKLKVIKYNSKAIKLKSIKEESL
jgi:hypothetical protein